MIRMLSTSALGLILAGAATADVPRVVADTPVAHALTALVMGDRGQPVLLLERGGDPHSAQLRPSQARAVVQADLVVWTSAVLSPWMADVIASLAAGETLELASVEGTLRQPFAGQVQFAVEPQHDDHGHDDHGHDHHGHDDHGHDDHGHDHHGHDDHGHDHADLPYDPHLWLEPDNAALWLHAIARRLGTLDAENAALYAANAATAAAELGALRSELAQTLAPAQGVGLVMHHDAYGYLARAFDLSIVGTISGGDAATPGAGRIAALRAELADAGATCIFPEANHPSGFVATVAEGSDLRIGGALDPAGMMGEPGPGLYAQVMRDLAATIAACVTGN